MEKPIIIANWKEYGTSNDIRQWLITFEHEQQLLSSYNTILCPPFTLLSLAREFINQTGIAITLGAQNVSRFGEGKYTGEVSAHMIAEFTSYAIIGHSERRRDLGETDATVGKKIKLLKETTVSPVVCVSDISQVIALKNIIGDYSDVIAYEPLFAIGSGNPDSPNNANAMASNIKQQLPNATIIYGGSVDSKNVSSFLSQTNISGTLVGNRSLDPNFFLEILKHAH